MANADLNLSPPAKTEVTPKERFFRYFQHEITALQEQMGRLADVALTGGERADATDHCLAGITRLSSEVKDASSYIPAYDQRTYAEAIKALQDKLQETRATYAPKPKFSFKTAHKNPSAISLHDAAELAAQKRRHVPGYRSDNSSIESSMTTTPAYHRTPPNETTPSQPEPLENPQPTDILFSAADDGPPDGLLDPKTAAIRRPTFSSASSVTISNHANVHIILPSSASRASAPGSLSSLKHCVIDMSVPTANGQPFAGLTVKSVRDSLLICGNVSGAAHITGVEDSAIVVSCHQFRMHECRNVDVYLSCSSRPIIEDCKNVRFSQVPMSYRVENEQPTQDLWDQVDDFKWLRPEKSPNWSLLPPEDAVVDEVWRDIVPGGPGWSLDDILKATKVLKV